MLFPALLLLALSSVLGSKECPHHCLCYEHSDLVDCRTCGFLQVPHGLSHGTWLLDLGGNLLMEVRSRAFAGLWSLRVLVLSDSGIQLLQPEVTHAKPINVIYSWGTYCVHFCSSPTLVMD